MNIVIILLNFLFFLIFLLQKMIAIKENLQNQLKKVVLLVLFFNMYSHLKIKQLIMILAIYLILTFLRMKKILKYI